MIRKRTRPTLGPYQYLFPLRTLPCLYLVDELEVDESVLVIVGLLSTKVSFLVPLPTCRPIFPLPRLPTLNLSERTKDKRVRVNRI